MSDVNGNAALRRMRAWTVRVTESAFSSSEEQLPGQRQSTRTHRSRFSRSARSRYSHELETENSLTDFKMSDDRDLSLANSTFRVDSDPLLEQPRLSQRGSVSTYKAARAGPRAIRPPLRATQEGGVNPPWTEPIFPDDEAKYAEGLAAYSSQFRRQLPIKAPDAEPPGKMSSEGPAAATPAGMTPSPPPTKTAAMANKKQQPEEEVYPMENVRSQLSRPPSVYSMLNFDVPLAAGPKPLSSADGGRGWNSVVLSDRSRATASLTGEDSVGEGDAPRAANFESVFDPTLEPPSQQADEQHSSAKPDELSPASPARPFSFGDMFGSQYGNDSYTHHSFAGEEAAAQSPVEAPERVVEPTDLRECTVFPASFEINEWLEGFTAATPAAATEETARVASFAPPKHANRVLRLVVLQAPRDHFSVSGGRTHLSIPSVSSTAYDLDEICQASSLYTMRTASPSTSRDVGKALLDSSLLTDAGLHVMAGHRTAVLLTVAEHATASAHAVVGEAVLGLLSSLEQKHRDVAVTKATSDEFLWRVDISVGAIHHTGTMKDLLTDAEVPMRAVANPLAGHWMEGMAFRQISCERDAATSLQPVRDWLEETSGIAQPTEMLAVFVTVRQVHNTSSSATERNVLLSSMLFMLTRGPRDVFRLLMNSDSLSPAMRSLVRPISTGAFVIAATCLTNDDAAVAAEYVAYCRNVSAMHLSSPSSGSVNRYIASFDKDRDWKGSHDAATSAGLQKMQAALDAVRNDFVRFRDDPIRLPVPFSRDQRAAKEERRSLSGAAASAEHVSPPAEAAQAAPTSRAPAEAARPPRAARPSSHASSYDFAAAQPMAEEKPRREPLPAPIAAEEVMEPMERVAATPVRRASAVLLTPPPSSLPATPPPLTGYAPFITTTVPSADSLLGAASLPTKVAPSLADTTVYRDGRLHRVAVVAEASGFSVDSYTTIRNVATGVKVPVEEALSKEVINLNSSDFSREARELCTLFVSGYNAGVISIDGRAPNLFGSPAFAVLRNAVLAVLSQEANTRDLRLTANLIRGTSETMDLMSAPSNASPSPFKRLQVATSPVFGPIPHDSTMYRIYSEKDLTEAIRQMGVAVKGQWDSQTAMCVTLVNCFSTKTDVMASSLTIIIYGSHVEYFTSLLQKTASRASCPAQALHKNILRGCGASLMLVSLNNSADGERIARELASVTAKKEPLRDCSVGRFVRLARANMEAEKAKANQSSSASASASKARTLQRIEAFVQDYEDLLYEPMSHFPKSYLSERTGGATPSRGTSQVAPMQQGLPTSHRASSAPGSASAATLRKRNGELVVFVEEGSHTAENAVLRNNRVTHLPTHEVTDVDGIVPFRGDSFTAEEVAAVSLTEDLAQHVASGRSCMLVGIVDDTASIPCERQPVWTVFQTLLSRYTFADSWEAGSCVQLRIVALFDRTIDADFLQRTAADPNGSGEAPQKQKKKKVSVGASPVFGTVVRNCAVVETTSARACEESVKEALARMAAVKVQDGTVIVASAVLKRVACDPVREQTDVVLSSVTAIVVRAERDLPALRDVLSLDPQAAAPCSLFRYGLGGPCRVMCLTSLSNCSVKRCSDALRLSARTRLLETKPAPYGSARNCVEQFKLQLSQSFDKMSATQRQYMANIIVDLEELLKNPTAAPIVVYGVDGADSGDGTPNQRASRGTPDTLPPPCTAPGQPVQCTVTYTHGNSKLGKAAIQRDASTVILPDGTSFVFDEVLVRADRAAVVRPAMANAIAQRVTDGFNCALLVTDATGSTAGPKTITRVISGVMHRVQAMTAVTLYMSVVALQRGGAGGTEAAPQGRVKDLLRSGDYERLRMAVSPLFGSCVNGAKFAILSRVGDVFVTLKDALSVCAVEEAALLVTIVMKREVPAPDAPNVAGVDVVMSSLNIAITTPDSKPRHESPAQLFRDAIHKPNERTLGALSGALSSPCYTFVGIGVSEETPQAEMDDVLRLGALLRGVRCGAPKKGSAMALRARALACLSGKSEPRDAAEADLWDWQHILDDTVAMLGSPRECKPKAYLLA